MLFFKRKEIRLLHTPSNQTQRLIKMCLILSDVILSLIPLFRIIRFGGADSQVPLQSLLIIEEFRKELISRQLKAIMLALPGGGGHIVNIQTEWKG